MTKLQTKVEQVDGPTVTFDMVKYQEIDILPSFGIGGNGRCYFKVNHFGDKSLDEDIVCTLSGTMRGKRISFAFRGRFQRDNAFNCWSMMNEFPIPGAFVVSDHVSIEIEIKDGANDVETLPNPKLADDITALWNKPDSSDFTVQVQDKTFFTHKLILSTRSPVLKAMLQSGLSETNTSTLTINDFDATITEHFLYFLYSDKCEGLSQDQLKVLLQMAHKYGVVGLQQLCEANIVTNNENCFELLSFADLYDFSLLKERSIKHIKNNREGLRQEGKRNFSVFNESLKDELLLSLL